MTTPSTSTLHTIAHDIKQLFNIALSYRCCLDGKFLSSPSPNRVTLPRKCLLLRWRWRSLQKFWLLPYLQWPKKQPRNFSGDRTSTWFLWMRRRYIQAWKYCTNKIYLGGRSKPQIWLGGYFAIQVNFFFCQINFLKFYYSSELWGFLAAAFPKAKYCLCTATMTDKALEGIAGVINDN